MWAKFLYLSGLFPIENSKFYAKNVKIRYFKIPWQ